MVNESHKQQFSLWFTLRKSIALMRECDPYYIYAWIAQLLEESVFLYYFIWATSQIIDMVVSKTISHISDTRLLSLVIPMLIIGMLDRVVKYQFVLDDNDFNNKFPLFVETKISEHRMSLDSAQLDDPQISNLSLKANESKNKINEQIMTMYYAIQNLFQAVAALVALVPYSLWISILFVVVALPELFISNKLQKSKYQIHDSTSPERKRFHMQRSFLQQVGQIRELKLNNIGRHIITSSQSIMDTIYALYHKRDVSKIKMRTVYSLVFFSYTVCIFLVLINDLLLGLVSIGYFTLLNSHRYNLGERLRVLMYNYNRMQANTLYLQDLFSFMHIQSILIDGTSLIPKSIDTIAFDSVSFAYPGSKKHTLHHLTVTIPRGSKVAIVGQNGAGKSTFTKLLLRFYDPSSGSVCLNSQPLPDFTRDDYYKRISYMAQDYNKYPFSLREAITLSDPEKPFDEIAYARALRISQVDDIVAKLPDGDRTQLSPQFDGGIEPSIGQWQKIAIARTLYKSADILILDEPTSAIDALSELHIFNEIEQLPTDVTVFLISHRFNTVKNADIILVIEHGTIVESGSHRELLQLAGRYAHMYNAQKDSYE